MTSPPPMTEEAPPSGLGDLRCPVPARILALAALIPLLTVLEPLVGRFIVILPLSVLFLWLMAELLTALFAVVQGRFERFVTIGFLIAAVPLQALAVQLPAYVHWALNVSAYEQTYRDLSANEPDALGVFFPWRGDDSGGFSPSRFYVDGICRDFPSNDVRPSRRWIGGVAWEEIPVGGSYFEDRFTYTQAIWGSWYACSFDIT